jgi:hypothetical protein
VSGDDASWSGQELGPTVTRVNTEGLSCGPSPLNPRDYLMVANSQDLLAVVRCWATGGDVRIRSSDVDIDGAERMYDLYTLSTPVSSPQSTTSYNNHLSVRGSDILVQEGLYVDLSLVGHAAEHEGRGGNAFSGDQSTPYFTQIEAIGVSSGEQIVWTGSIAGATTTVYATLPVLTLSAGTPQGVQPIGWGEVMRFNVDAPFVGDVIMTGIEFGFGLSDNYGSGWNECDTDSMSPYVLSAQDFSFYDRSSPGAPLDIDADWTLLANQTNCGTTPQVLGGAFLDLTSNPGYVASDDTGTFALNMNTLGASVADNDSVHVYVVSMCWDDGYVSVCSDAVSGISNIHNEISY